MRAVMVIGRMRSGGSAVAEVLNELGVQMGTMFYAPVPPLLRMEWEDVDLAQPLVEAALGGEPSMPPDYWRERLAMALANGRAIGATPRAIGVKTPALALCINQAREAAADVGLEPIVLVVRRASAETERSFHDRLLPFIPSDEHGAWIDLQMRIGKAVDAAERDLTIEYEALLADPRSVIERIARDVLGGGIAQSVIEDAVKRVRASTLEEVPQWQR